MDNLESQVETIEKIMDFGTRSYKIFLCSDNLLDHLASLAHLGKHQVHVKKYIDEMDTYMRTTVRGSDSGLYVFDSRAITDKRRFIVVAKSWFYYGARYESSAYLALLDKDNKSYGFSEQFNFESMCVSMKSQTELKFVLDDIGTS
jgi:hypothetical protein